MGIPLEDNFMDMNWLEIATKVATMFVPFLFALCFHEYAHGWVARLRGDNTAEMMGRLTMNPVAHMDFVGTLILPLMAILFPVGIFFGWAKPVPVNSRNLKNPRVDMFWIALAGPLSNILLAVLTTIVLVFVRTSMVTSAYYQPVMQLLHTFILINLFLAVFNALPLHPLDGGKILARFLPADLNYKLEQNEHLTGMILLGLILLGATKFLAIPVMLMFNFLTSF